MSCRHLIVVLGDQLDDKTAGFDGFDPAHDVMLQAKVREEAAYIPQHKLRIAFFFSAMRHFRDAQRALGRRVLYRELDDPANQQTLRDEINRAAIELQPRRIVLLEPGEWRIRQQLSQLKWPHEFRADSGGSIVTTCPDTRNRTSSAPSYRCPDSSGPATLI